MTLREAPLPLGVWFGVGAFAAMAILSAPETDWDDAVLYGISTACGIFVGFPVVHRLASGLRHRFAGGSSAYPVALGAAVGAVTVTAVWGWANFMGFWGQSWTDTVLGALILGLWNALVLGLGFGHLFDGEDEKEDTGAMA